MLNPNSAIDRIKNSLSYRLGLAIIECKKQHGGGYITLPYKLYKIKQQHFKEQKLYKQTIKIFPQLAYPKVESCKDYNESIRYKYHLSYMLGEALICAHKAWCKGGYFMLPSLLKEKYKIYKNIQDIISILPQKLHYHFYNSTIKNHKINIQDLIDILKQHKDYKPILENIFHNFDFFIKHFDLIRIWLSSKDFKEKYKQENHPYPSLLDPKKLNDENEKINYKNIPAELAWEMNLPLPDNYKFVYPLFGLSGGGALTSFFNKCGFSMNYDFHRDFEKSYIVNYNSFLKRKQNILYYTEYGLNVENRNKFLSLLYKNNIVFLVRDPISRLKTGVNHHTNNPKSDLRTFDLGSDYNKILKCKTYGTGDINNHYARKPKIDYLKLWLSNDRWFLYLSFLESLRLAKSNITYIDMEEIKPEKAFDTMCALANKFGFSKPTDESFFKGVMNGDLLGVIPFTLCVYSIDLNGSCAIGKNNSIHLQITSTNLIEFYGKSKEYINIVSDFFDKPLKYDNLGIFIKPQDYEQLKQSGELMQATKKYLANFIKALEERIEIEKSKLFKEDDVLKYLKENKELRIRLKELLDKELAHIKQYRPDIVASWKYYQEFEKMCKELDGN
ncbi:capsular polysaccharide biosynthesis protein, putative glycosyltransferase (DUF2972 domain) [Campylobacter subantarcticus LMG 24377]|uniref:Capsular polysaccharide biosynthesis protein, putative glycosyltransferase (DUF2972 domain) n=3 Tax=Campylobacter subantarcticus TaxID=497724 RepID=A0A0A8H980_9BACT|nr:capsular polysaccharide biosynthesis protein [Campylobacter subantarcticus]AJC90230.1 capsular polysaccharide biosynthesis protein, putative glycosyltransferase (DUF2972 domain) [Campylobacter subantarcticus LMG 24374]AJC91889.1 capsular polysaccharide biosynthesis protein, putative glycosyltransferase (DUF2972 domain) [Campylobacter subantarcticus LMG 24377]